MKNFIQKTHTALLASMILTSVTAITMQAADPVETTRQNMFEAKNAAADAQDTATKARQNAHTAQEQARVARNEYQKAITKRSNAIYNPAPASASDDSNKGVSLTQEVKNKGNASDDAAQKAKQLSDAADQAESKAQDAKNNADQATAIHKQAIQDKNNAGKSSINKLTDKFWEVVRKITGYDRKAQNVSQQLTKVDLTKPATLDPELKEKIQNLDSAQKAKIFNEALQKEKSIADRALKNAGSDTNSASLHKNLRDAENAIEKNINDSGMLKDGEMLIFLRKEDQPASDGKGLVQPLAHRFIIINMANFDPFAKNIDSSVSQFIHINKKASVSEQVKAMNLASNFYLKNFEMPEARSLSDIQEAIKENFRNKVATIPELKNYALNPQTEPINPEFLKFMTNRVLADQLTQRAKINPFGLKNITNITALDAVIASKIPSFAQEFNGKHTMSPALRSMIRFKYIEQTSMPATAKGNVYKDLVEQNSASFKQSRTTPTQATAQPDSSNATHLEASIDKSALDDPYQTAWNKTFENPTPGTESDDTASEVTNSSQGSNPFDQAFNSSAHAPLYSPASTTSSYNNLASGDTSDDDDNAHFKKLLASMH